MRPGDLVEVRSAAEILATLDGDAALDRMPFMPEIIPHTRRRYEVPTCGQDLRHDRVHGKPSHARHGISRESPLRWVRPRRLPGGLQPPYWTEAWLRRVDDDLCHPAKTLTHARMLRVRAGLPYPIGPPDVFAMTPGGAPGSLASGFSISRGRRE